MCPVTFLHRLLLRRKIYVALHNNEYYLRDMTVTGGPIRSADKET